jgi:hypothetical protein
MKNLFEPSAVDEVKTRLRNLKPDSQRQWGKMTPAQAVEHCARGFEWAVGDVRPPRAPIGMLLGWIVKPLALGDDKPLRRNSPTDKTLIVQDECDLAAERERIYALIDRFAKGGPQSCTTHPHVFFGRLTPNEWAALMYKHLDHHLRQFGA